MSCIFSSSTVYFQMYRLKLLQKLNRYIETLKRFSYSYIGNGNEIETTEVRMNRRISYEQLLVPMRMSVSFYSTSNRTSGRIVLIVVDGRRPASFYKDRRHLMRCLVIQRHIYTCPHIHPHSPLEIRNFRRQVLDRLSAVLNHRLLYLSN